MSRLRASRASMSDVREPVLMAGVAVRLLSAKQSYIEGVAARSRGDAVGRVHGAILIDQAVETALKTVLSHNGVSPGKLKGFYNLTKLVTPWVPEAATFLRHHDVRNAAQHEGVTPSGAELEAM